jgi:hypothetical protein
MKTLLLLAAVVLAAPAASFADHYYYPHSHWHGGYRYYGYPYGYYGPGPVVSFNFGRGPYPYSETRYYVPAGSSLEASVQRVLRREGYYSGPVDGDIGPRSRAAIRNYQIDHGLSATGRIDSRLLRSLGI